MSIKQARELGGKTFKEQWGASLLALLLGLAGVIAAGTAVPLIGGLIVQGPIAVGILFVYYKAVCGERIEHKEMLVGFKTNFGEIVLASLLKTVFFAAIAAAAYGLIAFFTAIFLFLPALAIIFDVLIGLAAIAALIVFALFLAPVEYIMMREPEAKGWEAVKKSKRIMKGHTGSLFGFTLSFIGWFLLTAVFFPIAIYTVPYYWMSRTFFIGSIYDEAERKAQENEEAKTEASADAPKKFCTGCGTAVSEDAAFCSKCGKEIKK